MNDHPEHRLSGPCYGLVQQVYDNGDISVRLYPEADRLSLFLFKPGKGLRRRAARDNVYGTLDAGASEEHSIEPGQVVRFDTFMGKPRYLVCEGRFKPGQLRKWEEILKKGLRPEVLSRYNDLVDQKFMDGLSETGEEEASRLERVVDAFAFAPVSDFLDELEKMLLRYVNRKQP